MKPNALWLFLSKLQMSQNWPSSYRLTDPFSFLLAEIMGMAFGQQFIQSTPGGSHSVTQFSNPTPGGRAPGETTDDFVGSARKCPLCLRIFVGSMFDKHYADCQSKKAVCPLCGHRTRHFGNLKVHIRNNHPHELDAYEAGKYNK